MKKIYLVLLVLLSVGAKAQWVSIPDTGFVTWLNTTYPQCMNGNLMDTTCPAIVNATTIDCSITSYIDGLYGIQYFDSAQSLYCGWNVALSIITQLPRNLVLLDCANSSYITSLPALPPTLKWLNCSGNQLSSLPALPVNLTELICNRNMLQSLPPLPDSLILLNCMENQISQLPALPSGMRTFWCSQNQLTSLPTLPDGLIAFSCTHNQLHSLPTLPDSLVGVDCNHNLISSLPSLPDKITQFFCDYNTLTSIPDLPEAIRELICDNNQITALPDLPDSLRTLSVANNPVSCLPAFKYIETLVFNGTNIACIPDSGNTSLSVPDVGTLPRCNSVDPNQCTTCNASFIIHPDSTNQGVYYGYNMSSGNNLNYLWSFGDSTTSSLPYPQHVYSQSGLYLICLTVSNNSGCVSTHCDSSFYVFKTEGGLMSELTILNPTVGISSVIKGDYSLSPNPATTSVTISIEESMVGSTATVSDITGREVAAVNLTTPYSLLNTASFSNGVYFVTVSNKEARLNDAVGQGSSATKKLVIQK